ncbi:hypothetical protein HON22_03425 [Candidatus Peregrinibacteria bacterium]|jgi:hypothetical protein|nr:hypothetical protein [Candidatus Peregrinibacteria bacterium]
MKNTSPLLQSRSVVEDPATIIRSVHESCDSAFYPLTYFSEDNVLKNSPSYLRGFLSPETFTIGIEDIEKEELFDKYLNNEFSCQLLVAESSVKGLALLGYDDYYTIIQKIYKNPDIKIKLSLLYALTKKALCELEGAEYCNIFAFLVLMFVKIQFIRNEAEVKEGLRLIILERKGDRHEVFFHESINDEKKKELMLFFQSKLGKMLPVIEEEFGLVKRPSSLN